MSIRLALALSSWSLPAISQTAAVETGPVTPEVPYLTVGATLVVGISLGLQCHASGSDTANCVDNGLLAGGRLTPRWRLRNTHLGIGFSTGFTAIGKTQSGCGRQEPTGNFLYSIYAKAGRDGFASG